MRWLSQYEVYLSNLCLFQQKYKKESMRADKVKAFIEETLQFIIYISFIAANFVMMVSVKLNTNKREKWYSNVFLLISIVFNPYSTQKLVTHTLSHKVFFSFYWKIETIFWLILQHCKDILILNHHRVYYTLLLTFWQMTQLGHLS